MIKHVGGNLERKIIDSSAVYFFRKSKYNKLQILLAKRRDGLKAFPGVWTGIGGKVDKTDREYQDSNNKLNSHTDLLKICAIREVYEEINILLVKKKVKFDPSLYVNSINDFNLKFEAFDWSNLIPSGLKITPEFTRINPIFKTQFFLYDFSKIEKQIVLEDDNPEYNSIEWNSPQDWINLFELQTIQIPPPVLSLLRCFLPNNQPDEAAKLSESKNKLPIGLNAETEVHPGIYPLPLTSPTIKPATTTNCIIIGDENNRYLIDPGSNLALENKRLFIVIQGLINDQEIKGIILTHHHLDHWSSIPAIQSNFNYTIPIFAHEETELLISNENVKIDKYIDNKSIFNLGYDKKDQKWEMESIYTGGHSEDHFVFLDKRYNTLIAGDLVAGVGTVLVENMGQYLHALDGLLQKDIKILIPGHGTINYKGHDLLKEYKRHRLYRLDLILEGFKKFKNKSSIEQLTKYAYKDVSQEYQLFAQQQVKTYLEYLIEEKKVGKSNNLYTLY